MALTPQEIRDTIDTRLVGLWALVRTKQADYLAQRGKYFQGLRTHTVLPADGNETAPDNLNAAPMGQSDNWNGIGGFPALSMSAAEMHCYDGPNGKGYVLLVRVKIGADVWIRRLQFGPETWRARGWEIETP